MIRRLIEEVLKDDSPNADSGSDYWAYRRQIVTLKTVHIRYEYIFRFVEIVVLLGIIVYSIVGLAVHWYDYDEVDGLSAFGLFAATVAFVFLRRRPPAVAPDEEPFGILVPSQRSIYIRESTQKTTGATAASQRSQFLRNLPRKPVAITATLILALGIAGTTLWMAKQYAETPTAMTDFAGLRFGMSPTEVKREVGEPNEEPDATKGEDGTYRLRWSYSSTDANSDSLVVLFQGKSREALSASMICKEGGEEKLFGIGVGTPLSELIDRLGQPSKKSTRNDSYSTYFSYKLWNSAFEIMDGYVVEICISSTGVVNWANEREAT